MSEPKRPKFDWGAIGTGSGSGGTVAGPARGGGARVTVLVSSAPGFEPEDNPNVALLRMALEAKHVLQSRGYPVRARPYSEADLAAPATLKRLESLGIDSLPAAVMTEANGHRRVVVGLRDSKAMLQELANRPPAAAEEAAGSGGDDDTSLEEFYNRELFSKKAWKAATEGDDESQNIGGTGQDLSSEYHNAMRSRGGGTTAPAASRESDVIVKAAKKGAGRDGGDGSGGEGGDSGDVAVTARDGAEILGAVAAVNDGDLDSGLMAKFWEGNTETPM
jgi:hypothetical protein